MSLQFQHLPEGENRVEVADLHKHHTLRAYGRMEVKLWLKDMGGHFHAPATLRSGKESLYPLDRGILTVMVML